VHTAASVAQARQVAGEMGEELDVVFSPLALPDGDGLGLMTELHNRYGCRTVCLINGDGPSADEGRRCAQAGIDRCVPRPTGANHARAAFARAAAASDGRN
jgi:CheY-like chemotaxis protein